jgi:hypothetical protein
VVDVVGAAAVFGAAETALAALGLALAPGAPVAPTPEPLGVAVAPASALGFGCAPAAQE